MKMERDLKQTINEIKVEILHKELDESKYKDKQDI